jgi:hypothetical protein
VWGDASNARLILAAFFYFVNSFWWRFPSGERLIMAYSTRKLPQGYSQFRYLDLSSEPRLMIILNIAALVLFFLFGALFLYAGINLRPDIPFGELRFSLTEVIIILGIYFFTLALHELIHGFFFFLFTRQAPKFGFKGFYAYAAAPDYYFPRLVFAVIGLGPFLLLTFLGFIGLLYAPPRVLYSILFMMTVNASGAVGDLYVTGWLYTINGEILVNDHGDTFTIYRETSN